MTILVGAQWGDEGKGKWIDVLSPHQDMVMRFQGGDNAGHTLHVDGQKYVFHHLPSSILHPKVVSGLLAGVVINPLNLLSEIDQLPSDINLDGRFWISSRSHVITPWHVLKDQSEESRSSMAIGTTLKGIGPCYADRVARQGLMMAHYIDPKKTELWLERYKAYDADAEEFLANHQDVMGHFFSARHQIAPHVCNLESRLRSALKDRKTVLCEGAQGTLLDLSHGTYPFVTSSHTIASGALVSMGVGMQYASKVIGVAKAYVTRVGEGPFPTELMGSDGQKLARLGHEFGSTTGRSRRCGWLDGVALRHACEVNGFDELYLNKCDILSSFGQIKLCTAYEHEKHGLITDFPEDITEYPYLSPIYETFPSWSKGSLSSGGSIPHELRRYLDRIEELCDVKVSYIGIGPKRQDYIKIS